MANNNAFAKQRDAAAFDFQEENAATAEQLVRAGFYPTVEKARERMALAVKRGNVRCTGYVQNEIGRDVKQFSRYPVGKPQHEYGVLELLLAARVDSYRRGHSVDEHHADADLTINGQLVYLEHDRGTMGYAELIERINKYVGCENTVLWVMSSATRIKGLWERTENLPPNFLFTTYEHARLDFHGPVWADANGVASCVDASVSPCFGSPTEQDMATAYGSAGITP